MRHKHDFLMGPVLPQLFWADVKTQPQHFLGGYLKFAFCMLYKLGVLGLHGGSDTASWLRMVDRIYNNAHMH